MVKALEQKLLKHNIKPTAMRVLVLDYFNSLSAAISLSALYEEFDRSDRITLYRTLKAFEAKGLVHSIDDGTGAPKYALCEANCNTTDHNDSHIHFHCDSCERTFCLQKFSIPEFDLPTNFIQQEVKLVVNGVCDQCTA
ncbi:transcriptional repressor [Marivirga sp. S37H4]|uniref:Transcriptional repressor n=1 Tax=Marivirga aurantiaca TaxID=2802615 RepID=A0A935CAP8_9BACT|nr:transcriptional repressor [Marivirga aurantiaca]MBK6264928.1 transcriptional repressor [Marivirga aurantiaca]